MRLKSEMQIYSEFNKRILNSPYIGIPKVYDLFEKPSGNYLVLEMLGPNLEVLWEKCGKKFSLKTTLQIAIRMLDLIEYIHSFSYIHMDVKPQNFSIGKGKADKKLYLIDFGIAHPFITENGEHLPWKEDYMGLRGTQVYVSTWIHHGVEASRRDDIISIGYCLIRFLKGTLPWEDYELPKNCRPGFAPTQLTLDLLAMKMKEKEEKTFVSSLPEEFCLYLDYAYELYFEQKPDYEYMRKLFIYLFKKNNFEEDNKFDWETS